MTTQTISHNFTALADAIVEDSIVNGVDPFKGQSNTGNETLTYIRHVPSSNKLISCVTHFHEKKWMQTDLNICEGTTITPLGTAKPNDIEWNNTQTETIDAVFRAFNL